MNGDIELRRTQARLREQQEVLRSQLVATELDLAITFCQVAATTKDAAGYERSIAKALEAFYAALYFLNFNHLKSTPDLEIKEKLLRLDSLLAIFERASNPALLHVNG